MPSVPVGMLEGDTHSGHTGTWGPWCSPADCSVPADPSAPVILRVKAHNRHKDEIGCCLLVITSMTRKCKGTLYLHSITELGFNQISEMVWQEVHCKCSWFQSVQWSGYKKAKDISLLKITMQAGAHLCQSSHPYYTTMLYTLLVNP